MAQVITQGERLLSLLASRVPKQVDLMDYFRAQYSFDFVGAPFEDTPPRPKPARPRDRTFTSRRPREHRPSTNARSAIPEDPSLSHLLPHNTLDGHSAGHSPNGKDGGKGSGTAKAKAKAHIAKEKWKRKEKEKTTEREKAKAKAKEREKCQGKEEEKQKKEQNKEKATKAQKEKGGKKSHKKAKAPEDDDANRANEVNEAKDARNPPPLEEQKVPPTQYLQYGGEHGQWGSQGGMMQEQLGGLLGELKTVTVKLEGDLKSNQTIFDCDPHLVACWSSLYNCAVSLYHIVGDIMNIQARNPPVPDYGYLPQMYVSPQMMDPQMLPYLSQYTGAGKFPPTEQS